MKAIKGWIVTDIDKSGIKKNARLFQENESLKPNQEKSWGVVKLSQAQKPNIWLRRRVEVDLLTGEMKIIEWKTLAGKIREVFESLLR